MEAVKRRPVTVLPLRLASEAPPAVPAASRSCSACSIRGSCLPGGMQPDDLRVIEDLTKVKRRVLSGTLLSREGDAFSALFVVRSGMLKSTRRWQSAQRVMAFHLPGDFVGLDAIGGGVESHDVWAMEDSEVCILPYAQLVALGSTAVGLHIRLVRVLSGQLWNYQHLLLSLGNMSAEQRLAWFLVTLSARYRRLGYAPNRFVLHMKQSDIASYLGLSNETVSRVLAQMRRSGLVGLGVRRWKHPEIELVEVEALQRLAGAGPGA